MLGWFLLISFMNHRLKWTEEWKGLWQEDHFPPGELSGTSLSLSPSPEPSLSCPVKALNHREWVQVQSWRPWL